ncbi:ORF6N domain-containing protein [Parabacteroides sp. PF5-6]|uniref:ORF6N domain-containing protein n=1 Tax=Parabacteroides sp. PF5-6 TaxID=1742403 RepID=UPI0024076259|nr:ORF6N domain-containing protein [Parabacteroides sp. PF5-6]MDF9830488.1 ribosomal protein S25 [Parabacteroides sp. PF5-6]
MEIQIIQNKIYEIRGERVMLDYDLAEMYGIETKVMNQAVRRNINRFPPDFMFQLTNQEFTNLMSQIVTSSWGGTRKNPFVFTEHGVTMLASVLRSPIAIEINIQIVRAFIALRQLVLENREVIEQLGDLQKQIKVLQEDMESLSKDHENYEQHFDDIYIALAELAKHDKSKEKTPLPKVGYLK